jgi:hypothetical protein
LNFFNHHQQGDEIGMLDYRDISWEDTVDPYACNTNQEVYKKFTRDPVRTPIQVFKLGKLGKNLRSEIVLLEKNSVGYLKECWILQSRQNVVARESKLQNLELGSTNDE